MLRSENQVHKDSSVRNVERKRRITHISELTKWHNEFNAGDWLQHVAVAAVLGSQTTSGPFRDDARSPAERLELRKSKRRFLNFRRLVRNDQTAGGMNAFCRATIQHNSPPAQTKKQSVAYWTGHA